MWSKHQVPTYRIYEDWLVIVCVYYAVAGGAVLAYQLSQCVIGKFVYESSMRNCMYSSCMRTIKDKESAVVGSPPLS